MSSHYDVSTRAADRPDATTSRAAPELLRRAGLLCLLGGLIAVVGTTWGITQEVPPADAMISAPQSPAVFRGLEVVWTLTHLLTLFGALGLAWSGLASSTRAGRVGTALAVIGMTAVIPCELAFIPVATSTEVDLGPMVVSTAIGVASLVAAIGFVIAGVTVLRAGLWHGPARFLPLLTGAWVFLGMMPLVIADGRWFYAGIGIWNALLALLGLAIARLGAAQGSARD